jgi:hypothetical protein
VKTNAGKNRGKENDEENQAKINAQNADESEEETTT